MTLAGQVLNNRYRLDKKIGEGGFAQVFLATDLVLDRTVAVKLLDTRLAADDADLLRRFQLEARAVAALDHSHILTVHDYGLLPETAFLVMPYVAGGPLSARLRAKRLTLEEAGTFLDQIGSALDYAHSKGIVHRDVKPQNILLRSDGRAVLTDFGFAKLLTENQAEAATRALGTVHYIAPEQIRGLVGPATDQYALGVLLYQMVSGVLPFNGSPQEMLLAHVRNLPPPLAQQPTMYGIYPDIVARLDSVIGRAMAKTAQERYPSCTALYEAYRAAINLAAAPTPPFGQDFAPVPDEKTEIAPPTPPRPFPAGYQAGGPAYPPTRPPGQDDATELYNPVGPAQLRPSTSTPRQPVMIQPPRLSVRTEPDQRVNLTFDLQGDTITFGRDLSNNLQIPLATVSRHHATLYRVGPPGPGMKYRIVDNKSRNQLAFRGQTITEKLLEDGDVVEIGKKGYGEYVVYLTYKAPIFQ